MRNKKLLNGAGDLLVKMMDVIVRSICAICPGIILCRAVFSLQSETILSIQESHLSSTHLVAELRAEGPATSLDYFELVTTMRQRYREISPTLLSRDGGTLPECRTDRIHRDVSFLPFVNFYLHASAVFPRRTWRKAENSRICSEAEQTSERAFPGAAFSPAPSPVRWHL